MNLKGKNIIVTGASGGMGTVLCTRLAEKGARLAMCSNDEDGLGVLKNALDGNGVYGLIDITREKDVREFFEKAAGELGRLDALVNLAGLSLPSKIESTDENIFDVSMDVNVKGAFFAGKYFAQNVSDAGVIINIGSMAARRANGNAPLYCTAKAAVNMLSQTMAIQMAEKNIRVTTLNPGGADTPFWGNRPVNRAKLLKAENVVDVMMFVLEAGDNIAVHSIDFESFESLKKS